MSIALLSAVSIACVEAAIAMPVAAAAAAIQPAETEITAPAEEEAKAAPVDEETATAETPSLDDAVANQPVAVPGVEPTSLVFADKSDDEVVDMVLGYIENISTLKGDFTQIAPSGAISDGEFHLRRPNQLRFEYTPPTPLLIVATQGNVYVEDKALETTDFYPIKKTPLRFLLSKKVDLGDAKVVSVDRGTDTVAVTFASEEEETEGELSIVLNAPEFSLKQWVVRDVQNGITVVTLNNVEAGGKFANRLFRAPDAGGEFLKN